MNYLTTKEDQNMNDINLSEIAKSLDLSHLAELSALIIDKDADSHNELISLIEERDSEIERLNQRISKLEADNANLEGIAQQTDQAITNLESRHNALMIKTRQKIEEKEIQIANLELQIKPYKELFGTPKKAKERLKTLREKNASHAKRNEMLVKEARAHVNDKKLLNTEITRLNKELIASKRDLVQDMFGESFVEAMESISWNNSGETLMLFHRQVSRKPGEKFSPALLYISPTGSASVVTLEDGEPTLSRAPKGGHRPKAATSKFAKEWLNKVKSQGIVKIEDLNALKNGSLLQEAA